MLQRVTVNAWNKALVFKNNRFVRILNEGKYWLVQNETVMYFDMTRPFFPEQGLEILLKEEAIANALDIITVAQAQLYVQYDNGIFNTVLPTGRYAFWKGMHNYTYQVADLTKVWITEPVTRTVLAESAMAAYVRMITVGSFEKALLYVNGKFEKELSPGQYYFWKTPETIQVYSQDMRQVQLDINGQEILTRDKASLRINCTLQYKVADLFKAVANKEFDRQLYVIVQFALRELVTAYTLDELLEKRDGLAPQVLNTVKERAAALGVEVMDCGIRDVILPGDVKEIMNQVLLAEKKAQANIITRREETASTRSLLNTAKLMEENEMLFKLKEMEYVEKISDKITNLSVTGGGDLVAQLRQLFVPRAK